MAPMTITDPTAHHSSTRSIVSKATQWTIDALAPLREHLSPWPVVLPSKVGDPIRPLKIGVRSDLAVLLPDGEAHEVLGRVLRRYTRGREYLAALAASDALRHDLVGNPVEPVAEEHKTHVRPSTTVEFADRSGVWRSVVSSGRLWRRPDGAGARATKREKSRCRRSAGSG